MYKIHKRNIIDINITYKIMKTKIIFIIVGILFTSVTAFAFSDLTNNHTYNEAINFITENNIVQGYPDGTFKPDNKINRAELLKIIIESKFSDDEIDNALNEYRAKNYWYVDLKDVDIDSWYGSYVRIAIQEGIIEGYSDGTFKPSQNVNFVEALKIVLKTYNIDYTENTTPWYKGLVEKGAELNLNPLDITAFNLNITRAQMADLITRILKYQNKTLDNYLDNAVNTKQTYTSIKNGEDNIKSFINKNNQNYDIPTSGYPIVEFTSSKDIYEIGEPIEIDYDITYSGEPFSSVQLLVNNRDGFEKKMSSKLSSSMKANEKIDTISISPFSINDSGYSTEKMFKEEGFYTYTVYIYDCNDVAIDNNNSCFENVSKDMKNISPIASASKTIEIILGSYIAECKDDNECTKPCIGCNKKDTQFCSSEEKCIDCFMDLQCKSGYKCKDSKCIEYECGEDTDCTDNDVSTKDTCTDYKCSHTAIIKCLDNDLYCPEGCNESNDNDCGENKCGNEVIDCGRYTAMSGEVDNNTNLDCFIDAAKNCCPAKIISEIELNMFGMLIHSKSYREVKGLENERCILFDRIDDYTISISEEDRQEALDSGVTEEEIEQQLLESNQGAQEMIGKDNTCKYPIQDLVNILENEKEGSFSGASEDVEKYQCTGSLYE